MMKISECKNAPDWLVKAQTVNADVDVLENGMVVWKSGDFNGGDFMGGNFMGGYFMGGNFMGGNFMGGYFKGGNFKGGNFKGGYFMGGNFMGGNFMGVAVKNIKWFKIYKYSTFAVIGTDNIQRIAMGCYFLTREQWEKDFWNNPNEFPNDGSEKSEMRKLAFDVACKWLDIVGEKPLTQEINDGQ